MFLSKECMTEKHGKTAGEKIAEKIEFYVVSDTLCDYLLSLKSQSSELVWVGCLSCPGTSERCDRSAHAQELPASVWVRNVAACFWGSVPEESGLRGCYLFIPVVTLLISNSFVLYCYCLKLPR